MDQGTGHGPPGPEERPGLGLQVALELRTDSTVLQSKLARRPGASHQREPDAEWKGEWSPSRAATQLYSHTQTPNRRSLLLGRRESAPRHLERSGFAGTLRPWSPPARYHPGGVNVLFMDGSVFGSSSKTRSSTAHGMPSPPSPAVRSLARRRVLTRTDAFLSGYGTMSCSGGGRPPACLGRPPSDCLSIRGGSPYAGNEDARRRSNRRDVAADGDCMVPGSRPPGSVIVRARRFAGPAGAWFGMRSDRSSACGIQSGRLPRPAVGSQEGFLKQQSRGSAGLAHGGRCPTRLKQGRQAEEYYRHCGSSARHLARPRLWPGHGPARTGRRVYPEMLEKWPEDVLAVKRLAAVLMELKQWKPALAALRAADPDPRRRGGGPHPRGIGFHVAKHAEQAVSSFERVLAIDPDLKRMPLPSRFSGITSRSTCMAIGRTSEAREYLQRATRVARTPARGIARRDPTRRKGRWTWRRPARDRPWPMTRTTRTPFSTWAGSPSAQEAG